MGGGRPVAVEGELPLWGMQIDVAAAAEEVRAVGRDDGAKPLDDFLGSVGLGALGEQLKDLRLSAPAPAPAKAVRAGAGAAVCSVRCQVCDQGPTARAGAAETARVACARPGRAGAAAPRQARARRPARRP